jgi:hypothetical protein
LKPLTTLRLLGPGKGIVEQDSEADNSIKKDVFFQSSSKGIVHPDPYTVITHQDVKEKKWVPIREELQVYFMKA